MVVEAGGIGARLRAGRERLGLTVLQTAERLHVDPKILEYLEADNFEALGAPVYARGHLRHYAEFVGESVSQLNELYSQGSQAAQPDLTRIAKAPPASEANKLVAPALLVLAIFAVAGAVWWVLSLSGQTPGAEQPHVVGQPPSETPETQPGPTTSGSATSGTQAAPSAAAPNPGAVAGVRLATSAAPGTRLASAAPSGPETAENPGQPNPSGTPTAAPHSSHGVQVALHFSADSWTEVYDASGARLFYDVGTADSTRTLSGALPFRIVLGNAAGVSVEVNGRSTDVAKWALPDGSAQFLINRSGHAVRARSENDGG